MVRDLVAGVVLGLPAGLVPGPLLNLVITQTLRHGTREGLRVAIAPLLTDAPIIALSVWVLDNVGSAMPIMGIISLAGASFLVFLAVESLRAPRIQVSPEVAQPESIGKGAVVNLLNPHPYAFWLTVGSPLLVKAWHRGVPEACIFLGGFYVCMVGSKVLVAVLAGGVRHQLKDDLYVSTMRVLGVTLLIFAGLFAYDGLRLLYRSIPTLLLPDFKN